MHMCTCTHTHSHKHIKLKKHVNCWKGPGHPEQEGALWSLEFDERTHPACPVDEVIQLGHHILGPALGKMGGLGDHSSSSSLGHSRLCANGRTGEHKGQLARHPQCP